MDEKERIQEENRKKNPLEKIADMTVEMAKLVLVVQALSGIKKEGKDCLLAKTLRLTNQKHDITAIQVEDIFAKRLPNIGLLKAIDAETGHELWIDTSSKKTRTVHERAWQERQEVLRNIFSKSMVDWTCITTGEDFVRALIILFKQKG